MKVLISRFFLVFLAIGFFAQAQEEKAEKIDANTINEDAEILPSAGEMVDKAIEDYALQKKITYGTDYQGRTFYSATATVSVPPTSAQWAKSRTLAFEEAVSKAQAEFVRDQFGKQFVETSRKLLDNQSDGADEFTEETPTTNKLKALYNKLVALEDAKVNEKLEEVGIDPEEYSAKSEKQRLTLFCKAMTKTMVSKAIGQVAGMTVVQTFEGSTEDGNHVIGVVLCYSPKLRQLASDISKRRIPLLTGQPKKTLAEHIPTDPKILANQFGTRVLFDENGQPVLVSYGQWSHNYTGKNNALRERRREAATKRAVSLADSYITEFLDAKLNFLREAETGEVVSEFMEKDGDGNVSAQETSKIIDIMREKVTSRAKADLAGRQTFRRWTFKHPSGNVIVGAVRTWTLENLEANKKIRNWKPDTRRPAARNRTPQKADQRKLQQGEDTDINDF